MKKLILLILCFLIGNKIMAEDKNLEIATLAGGCFWCIQHPFDAAPGVVKTVVGYTGGNKANPTYEEVSSGTTGHKEAMQVHFDPKKISYEKVLDIFWMQIDPTDAGGQFVDRGNQYTSAIFYHSEEQKKSALKSKEKLEKSGQFNRPIVTEIKGAGTFYSAEDYHQKYYEKNPIRYKFYRSHSGRDQFLKKSWKDNKINKKVSKEELKKKLNAIQYKVTQESDTEPAFHNEYWDNKKAGLYVDVVSGEPLFTSIDKFDSGTGWPSFSKPLKSENIVYKEDNGFFMKRTEVRSAQGDSHLGHVFPSDAVNTGKHYCINSASLRFIPVEKLEAEGYAEYLKLFQSKTQKKSP